MNSRKGICKVFRAPDVVLAILILMNRDKKWIQFSEDGFKSGIRRLKLEPRFELLLQDFNFENCGLVALTSPIEGTLFILKSSGELTTRTTTSYEYNIEIDKNKKDYLFSKFSQEEKEILEKMAKKVHEIIRRGF